MLLLNKSGEETRKDVIFITTKKHFNEIEKNRKPETRPVFTKTEVEAQFPGGKEGWQSYLQKNLNASTPVDKGAPEGSYTVQVQFIVHPDGYLSDIKPLTHHGYGMEEEVVQLIKKGPKWVPAEQNGHAVASIRKQPVTFVISKQ